MNFRIFVLTFFSVLIVTLHAQPEKKDSVKTEKPGPDFRVEAGYGQTFRYGDNSVTSPYHVIRTGVNVEFPITRGFGVETGLKYSYAFGNREQIYAHSDTAFFKYAGHFLDVPVRLTYTLPIFWGMKLFAYAGPNFNIGIAHTEDVDFTPTVLDPVPSNPLNYPVTGTYNSYDNDLRRLNIQLGAGGGLQWKDYRVKSGYEWGLNNVNQNKNRSQKMKGWFIAFEYEF